MKKFLFKYQKVLQVRINVENEFKNELGKINKAIIEKEIELTEINERNNSFLEFIDKSVEKGIKASELQSIERNKKFLITKIIEIKYQLRMLINKRVGCQKELIEANKQRKVMEKLKEKDFTEYLELESVEELKIIDQIVTYNSSRKGGE